MNKRTMKVLGVIVLILFGGYVIAQISAARHTPRYLQDLSSREPDKVMDALAALRERGKTVGPGLAQLVQSGQEEASPRAAWLLGMIGSHAGDQVLLQAVNSDKAPLRIAAIQALGQLRAPGADVAIAGVLAKSEEKNEVRVVAAYALGQLKGSGVLAALTKALAARPGAAPPVPAPGTPSVSAPASGPTSTTSATGGAGPPPAAAAAPPPDTTIPVRVAAARALGELRDPGAISALAEAVSKVEPDPEVRVAAAYSLGDVLAAATEEKDSRPGIEALVKGLEDEVGDVRIACAYALAKTHPPADMETELASALSKATDDDHYWTRQAAARSIALLRLPE